MPSVVLRTLKSIEITQNRLVFKLHHANYRILEALSLPIFCPIKNNTDGLSSGQYVKVHGDSDPFLFSANRHQNADFEFLKISVIKDPDNNIARFNKAALSLTADTAFPLYRFNEYRNSEFLKTGKVGLYSGIVFGKSLASEDFIKLRQLVALAIGRCDFSAVTHGVLPQLFKKSDHHVGKFPLDRPLVLAYDPYYPNREICECLVKSMEQIGIKITLFEDSYERPCTDFDLRFSILRGLSNNSYLRFLSLLLNPALQSSVVARSKFMALISAMELSKTALDLESCFEQLNTLLQQYVLSIPLFEIPSIYLSKYPHLSNPLTQNLRAV